MEDTSLGASGSAVSWYPAAPPPPTDQSTPFESRSVSWETRKLADWEATDSNFPIERGAAGFDMSKTST